MSSIKPNRRCLQFSLRSILLLTLAVALWLGYEVRQARHVERTIAAIRALGGDAECEPTRWSLLRLCRVPGYGQHIVRAEIPGAAADEAIGLLRDLPSLREVQVIYDGTYDPTPSWKCIQAALSDVVVAPRSVVDEEPYDDAWDENLQWTEAGILQWKASSFGRRLTRVRARLVKACPQAVKRIDFCLPQSELLGIFKRTHYRPVLLPDGGLAEVFVYEDRSPGLSCGFAPAVGRPSNDCFVALIVEDECVDVRGFCGSLSDPHPRQHAVLEDLDHDGLLEVGFDDGAWGSDQRRRNLSGDARNWLGVYKINRDGFESVLPEDTSDFP